MAMVKVVNTNEYVFTQEFKGQPIKIPPMGKKNWVEMDREEAIEFVGLYYPAKKDGMDQPDPRWFKKLHIEEIASEADEDDDAPSYVCQKCSFKCESQEALDDHIDEFHLDDLADPKVKEKRMEAAAKKKGGKPFRKDVKNEGQGPNAA